MTGTVVTFYSYKGGVGRSFALANTAVLLGRWGFRVLCIDWDLEAPGLAHFFAGSHSTQDRSMKRADKKPGLVELFSEFREKKQVPLEWRRYVLPTDERETPGLSLIVAGKDDALYTRRLHRLKWESLYRNGLGDALEGMFDELREEYDFIFIDSRTGVTDFSGIVTAQLPDILAFLFTANEQSFEGATDIARRATIARNSLAIDRSQLLLLPIPARFETQVEHSISLKWRERFADGLGEFYKGWAFADAPPARLVQATTIPYVPFWSFGERLSVVEDSTYDPLSINYSLETIAGLLAHRLGQTRLLLESRDEFVNSARRLSQKESKKYSIFLSYSRTDRQVASALARVLERRGLQVFIDRHDATVDGNLDKDLLEGIQRSQHMVALLGAPGHDSRWQNLEIRTFLRQAASDEGTRMLIPFLIGETSPDEIPDLLRQYKLSSLRGDVDTAADEVIRVIRPNTAPAPSKFSTLTVRAAEGDEPVEGASVTALAQNGTTIDATTDQKGIAVLKLLSGKTYTLLAAHPKFRARIIEHFDVNSVLELRFIHRTGTGSAILHSTGYIPGLNGRINPIRDTANRTYLYAENIAVKGGVNQPAAFLIDESFELEDAVGTRFDVTVKLIAGRTSLLEFSQLP